MEQVLDKMFIDSAISSLSKELKEVVVLYYLDGFKIAEIAEKLQISLSLAKYRLTNARKQLEIFGREEDIHEKNLKCLRLIHGLKPNEEKLWTQLISQ